MRFPVLIIIAALFALTLPSTARAAGNPCPLRPDSEQDVFPGDVLELPDDLDGLLSVKPTDVHLSRLSGEPICVSLSWIAHIFAVHLSDDRRFFGFAHSGFESFGYTLVDRAVGQIAATGARPSFSDDGRMLAAIQLSDAGWGNMEGLALWEVTPEGLISRAVNDIFPYALDYRADGWRDGCFHFSSVLPGWRPENSVEDWDDEIAAAPRSFYFLYRDEGAIHFIRNMQFPRDGRCGEPNAADRESKTE